MNIDHALSEIREAAQQQIMEIAAEYRRRTLIPFCRKHRLTFLSGNGTWTFYKGDRLVDYNDVPAIAMIDSDLNVECLGRHDHFGFYMDDVRASDIKRKSS